MISPLALSRIKLTDAFWSRWQKVIADQSLPAQYRQLESTGRVEHFRRVARGESGGFAGYYFNDSDVYKWLEAAAYAQLSHPSAQMLARIDELTTVIEKAQEPDGYIDTFFQLNHPTLKWRNLGSMHEMYCAGHLFEAAVALHECLGHERLLRVATKLADLIDSLFGADKRLGYCGHEEVELGLLLLSRATNDQRYADLATWMIEARGSRPSPFDLELDDEEAMKISPYAPKMLRKDGKYSGEYCQDHLPIREHVDVVGHAVRAMYLYTAAAEIADESMLAALERCWHTLTTRRMYVTGGIGPSGDNEGFSTDYDLPNLSAYAETCASCGLIFWARAMLNRTEDSSYADVLERALYNGAISGFSLDGTKFFYTNPLECRGNHDRQEWFSCACCPPNIARLIGSLGGYLAGVSGPDFYIHVPAGFEADHSANGVDVKVRVESNYPWSGAVKVHIDPARPVEFAVHVRLPEWADDIESDLPGLEGPSDFEKGYAIFRKTWLPGDVLALNFEMQPKWVESDPRVLDNLGRLALTRGPLIYCAESPDLHYSPQLLSVDSEAEVTVSPSKDDLGTRLTTQAIIEVQGNFPDDLYADAGTIEAQEVPATFIPYFAWANRGPSDMQVWIRRL